MGKINNCLVYGQMMELANRVVLETTVLVTCGFKSRSAHHKAFSANKMSPIGDVAQLVRASEI